MCSNCSGDCWPWPKGKNNTGYGIITWHGRKQTAHRVVYEQMRGPIPDGLTLDHLCRNRSCVNPWHMEPVTLKENILRGQSPAALHARKKVCPWGHAYTSHIVKGKAHRFCKTCKNASARRNYVL